MRDRLLNGSDGDLLDMNAALSLSNMLEQFKFDQILVNHLAQLKAQLESNVLSEQAYFANKWIKEAIDKVQLNNQRVALSTLQLWWAQPHTFSVYEKVFLALSSVMLLATAVLSYEVFVLLLHGKPSLEATGDGIKEYCTGELTGLSGVIVDTCTALSDGVTAVFSMNKRIDKMPDFVGVVDDSSSRLVLGATFQSVKSWFNPIGWINFFMCQLKNTTLVMTGHTFPGALSEAQQRAGNGFPVLVTNVNTQPDPFLGNTTGIAINAFLAMFCLLVQNGGYSVINDQQNKPYGHFDGFERFGDSFQAYAYAFAGVYSGLAVISFLTMATLLCKKGLSKWRALSAEREVVILGDRACDLFSKFAPVQVNAFSPAQENLGERRNSLNIGE